MRSIHHLSLYRSGDLRLLIRLPYRCGHTPVTASTFEVA